MFQKTIKILFLLSAIFIQENLTDDAAIDCSNSDPVTIVFNDPIDLTYNGDIRIYANVIINNLSSITNNDFDKLYIDARLEPQTANNTKSLIIFTTQNFPNYAKEQAANRITLRVIYGCDGGRQRTLIFYQAFKEGNYYRPEFSKSLYEFTLPMPLYAGFDLTTFGMISARDDDLTGNEIHFSSDEASFYFIGVATKPVVGEDRKTYYAQLTLERIYLALATEIQFNITATDSGNPPLNSTAMVIMRADPANTIPMTPQFEQLIYHAELNESLEMPPLLVQLKNTTYTADVSFEKLGTDQGLFEITNRSNILEVRLASALKESDVQNKKFLQLEIKASNQKLTEFGQTAVIVAISNNTTQEIAFSKFFYQGNLTTQNEELQHDPIQLNVPEEHWQGLSFQLDVESAKYFVVNQTGNNAKLKLKNGLEKRVWQDKDHMITTLNALYNENETLATTNIFLNIIKRKFEFEHEIYNGSIDALGNITMENILLETSDNTTVDINYTLHGTHAGLLELQLLAPNRLQIKLNSTLLSTTTGQQWQNEKYLTANIQAADELYNTTTLLLIQPLENANANETKQGSFQKPLYQGEVDAKANQLAIEPIIFMVEDTNNNLSSLTFALNNIGQQYFIVEQKENNALLKIRPDLEISQWKGLESLQAQLYALYADVRKSTAELLIHNKQRWIKFDHSIYNGSLDARNFLNLTQITFESSDNSTEGINVSLAGEYADSFHIEHFTVNVVMIKVNDNVSAEMWQHKKFISLNIVAQDQLIAATSLILLEIEQWQLKDSFRFVSPLYEGNIEENATLNMPTILFNEAAYDDAIDFQLHGKEQQLFNLQKQRNHLVLQLNDSFKLENWKNQSYFTLEISAQLNDQHDRTAVFIKLPQPIINVVGKQPIFESPLYFGKLYANGELTTGNIQLKAETYVANKTEFKLIEQGSTQKDLFEIIVNEYRVELKLKRQPNATELENNFAFTLLLVAVNQDLEGYASIVIEPPSTGGGGVNKVGKVFLNAWQNGRIELMAEAHQQILQISHIHLQENHKVEDFSYKLEGNESKYFSTSIDAQENVIKLQLTETIPVEVLQAKAQLNLLLNAVKLTDKTMNGSTLIFIELPKEECPNIPTVQPLTDIPKFDNDFYTFAAQPNQLGSIGSVNAKVESSNAKISYSLNVQNEHLSSRISINANSGELQLLSYISPGIYQFVISAQNMASLAKSDINARLNVDSIIQCDDGQTNVANTLIIKYIEEEKVHTDIMVMSMADCEYHIHSMFPDDKAYVSIDAQTKMLTSIKIDREDAIFANMTKPQVQVKLKLQCNNNRNITQNRNRRDLSLADYSLIWSQDMPYARDVTVLHLILIDINDNAPKFIYPAKPTHIGYPESKICLELFPEYLTQVHAIDIDEGLNAKIRYSLRQTDQTSYFAIDAETGIIYPTSNALQILESTTLYIKATDRDGAADGLSTEAILYVKRLNAEYFTLLTLRTNNEWQDLNAQLKELEKKTKYQINTVKMATIPSNGAAASMEDLTTVRRRYVRAETANTFIQKVWVYAFQADAPVTSDDFKHQLSTLSNSERVFNTAETFKEVGLKSNQTINEEPPQPPIEANFSGYIAAVTLLSILLFCALGFILWHFYLQEIYQQYRKSTSTTKLENETTQPSTPVAVTKQGGPRNDTGYLRTYLNRIDGPKTYDRRPSLDYSDITTQEANDDLTQAISAELKSAVKFNELVERIHIDVERPGCKNHEEETARL